MHTGWTHAELPSQRAGDRIIGVRLLFEHERLDGGSLWIVDARYGTSWDDWSEDKELALRDAHDTCLVEMLGPGSRVARVSGSVLEYSFEWGGVWSSYDGRSASSSIGVRYRARGRSA